MKAGRSRLGWSKVSAAGAALGIALGAGLGPAAAQIGVTVNGTPVRFSTVTPKSMGGRVFIPLRAVSEALGAELKWDQTTQTVYGRKGEREFSLPIGARTAVVNQIPVTLDVPAQMAYGTTMVPLRFVAEALGAEVEWDPSRQQVLVSSKDDAGGPIAASDRINGEVVAVRPEERAITVMVRGVRQTYRVGDDTILLRGRTGERGSRVGLDEIQPGDQVRLRVDPQAGMADVVEATVPQRPGGTGRGDGAPSRERITGEVIAVRSNANPPTIVLRTEAGRESFEVSADAALFRSQGMERGMRVRLEELEPGDQVRLRLNRAGTLVTMIDAVAAGPGRLDPQPQPAADLRISSFSHEATGILRSGQQLQVTMLGTPGATGSFDVGSLAKNVPLREDPRQPGRYSGTFTIPAGITARDVPVIGTLRVGERTAPLIQAGTPLIIDSEPPAVTEVAPADRSQTANAQPDIYLELSDGAGAGIDPASLRMFVRGRDVTQDLKLTRRFAIYTPKAGLAPGDVPVQVTVRDLAGNQTQTNWTFTVRPSSEFLQSVSHDADRALRAGDTLTVTVRGQARGRATFSLGDVARNLPMNETTPGTYVGRYQVRPNDPAVKVPVSVDFTTPAGEHVKQDSTTPVNLVARALDAPAITSPGEDFQLGDELVVQGTGTPGSKIMVEVTYTGRAFGALPVRGSFGSQEVTVRRGGRWTTEPFAARLPLGTTRPELTIRAVAVDAAGTESKPATLTLRPR